MDSSARLPHWLLLAAAVIGGTSAPASAQTYTWVGTTQNWSSASNWSSTPGGVPNAPGAVARFNGSGVGSVSVDGNFTVGRVTFDYTTANFTQGLTVYTPGFGLTLDNGPSSASVIEVVPNANGAGSGLVANQVTIAGNNVLNLLAPNNTTLSFHLGPITGSASTVNVNAGGQTGIVQFSGANTYGGAGSVTTVGGGRLVATDGVGLPTNTALVLNGAIWETTGTVTRSLGTGDGQLQITGAAAGFNGDGTVAHVRLGNGTGTVTWGDPAFNPGALILGASPRIGGGPGGVVFENGLNLNGADRTIRSDGPVNTLAAGGTVSGVISNPVGSVAGVVKDGAGILTLSGANTYNGATTVQAGVLRAIDGQGLPAASNLVLNGGSFESPGDGTLSRVIGTTAGQVQWTGSGGALSAKGGTLTVQLNPGSAAPLVWGSAGFVAAGNSLKFGSGAFDGVVDFRNDLDLAGGTRTISSTGPVAAGAAGLVRMSGVISNGSLAVFADAGSTVELAATNTYTGQTTVQGGALRAAEGVGLPSASNLNLTGGVLEGSGPTTFTRSLGTGAGQVQIGFAGGFSAHGGPMTVRLNNGASTLTWASLGLGTEPFRLQFGSRTADNVTDFQNGLDLGGQVRFFQVDDNHATGADLARISGVITNGGVTMGSLPGTLELSAVNTYTGQTTVQGGALRANDGVGLPTASNLVLAGGVLEGSGPTTFTRSLGTGAGQVQFTSSGGGFSASGGPMAIRLNNGTGTVTWGATNFLPSFASLRFGSETADNVADFQNALDLGGGNRTIITLAGNPGYTGPVGRISGVISNGGLNLNFNGDRPGTLELTAANTYAGGTSVNFGRLLVNNTTGTGTGTGSVTIGSFGALTSAALAGGGTIAPGAGNSVTVNNGARIEPGSGTDTSLRIATTGGGTISIGTNFAPAGPVTWAVRVAQAGAGGVAADSGGSTTGSVPDPTNHTFLDLSGGGANTVLISGNTVFEVDGTGAGFVMGQRYSYTIGRVGAANELQGGPLNITDQSRFVGIGFQASDFSVTSDGAGLIHLNFTPVPEPGTVLLAAAAGLGLAAGRRRLLRRGR